MAQEKKSREIDVVGTIRMVLREPKLLARFVVVFAIWGVVVALNRDRAYTTTVILAPEFANTGGLAGGLSNLASMVGVNLGSSAGAGMDAIYPQIYPDVMTSSDFIVSLFDIKVKTEEEDSAKTYYNHINNDGIIPFWLYPRIWVSKLFETESQGEHSVNPQHLTKRQSKTMEAIRANIACVVDKNTSVVSISVTDIDKIVSAQMADTIQKSLQAYITEYRTKKAKEDLAYAERMYAEAKDAYQTAQKKYSDYCDSNDGLYMQAYKSKRDELENEMQLRYNIYVQIAQQVQIANAKVQERTPAFSVVQSASVPTKPSSTPKAFIVLLYIVLGVVCDTLWLLYFRKLYMAYRERRKS